jgi:hypothetical protein
MWHRHLYGVALAVLLAAALFFVAAGGYVLVANVIGASVAAGSGTPSAYGGGLPAAGGSLYEDLHLMVGGVALVAVGLAVGLLMVIPRVSPLAAGLPGLVLVAWTVLYVMDVQEAVRLIPLKSQDFGTGFELLLFTGLPGAAGMAMIAPMFIPSRWRRPARAPGYAAPDESPLGQLATVAASTGGSAETGGADPDPTVAGFAAPLGGESSMLPDETQTRPQQGQVIPPGGYQAP